MMEKRLSLVALVTSVGINLLGTAGSAQALTINGTSGPDQYIVCRTSGSDCTNKVKVFWCNDSTDEWEDKGTLSTSQSGSTCTSLVVA
jgi:hypothetical protein